MSEDPQVPATGEAATEKFPTEPAVDQPAPIEPAPIEPEVNEPEASPQREAAPDPLAAPPPPPPPAPSAGGGALPAQRPEVAVGAAFAGGLLIALALKRLAR